MRVFHLGRLRSHSGTRPPQPCFKAMPVKTYSSLGRGPLGHSVCEVLCRPPSGDIMSQPAITVDPSTFLSGLVDALQRLFFGNTARR